MFENKLIRGVHATRYINSYLIAGGLHWELERRAGYSRFEQWLKSLKLSEDEIGAIMEIGRNGKLELQEHAKEWLKQNKT